MSHLNPQQEAPVSYPPPSDQAYPAVPYATAPPVGYPSTDGPEAVGYPQQRVPEETKSRGKGFWEGCCAAICCCCVLDCCF